MHARGYEHAFADDYVPNTDMGKPTSVGRCTSRCSKVEQKIEVLSFILTVQIATLIESAAHPAPLLSADEHEDELAWRTYWSSPPPQPHQREDETA